MVQYFQKAFSISVEHQFVVQGTQPGFKLNVLGFSRDAFQSQSWLLKKLNNSFAIIYEATDDSGTPKKPLANDLKLYFGFNLLDKNLLGLSDMPNLGDDERYYFQYTGTADVEINKVKSWPEKGGVERSSMASSLTMEVADLDGEVLQSFTGIKAEDGGGLWYVNYDLSAFASGMYQFNVLEDGLQSESFKVLVDNEFNGSGHLALFELEIEKTHNLSSEEAIKLKIDSLSKSWKYHLRLSKDYEDYTINIADKEVYSGGETYSEFKFYMLEEPDDYEKGELIVFQTGEEVDGEYEEQEIPLRDIPKKHLQLELSSEEETIIFDLPNPEVHNFNKEIYLTI